MDESLQELENELKRLHPRQPATELVARIDRELQRPVATAESSGRFVTATSFRSWKWLGWSWKLAAVAAMAGGIVLWRQTAQRRSEISTAQVPAAVVATETSLSPANLYRPVAATNVLYDLKDDGAIYLGDNLPAHQVRYRYLDTYTWKNPATHASLKWSVPREEVRIVPISLN